jgi:hypothetical protein
MATQHNVFIRKFGNLAIVITVTDWEDFKELEKHSKHESPDFLLSGITDRSIYTNMNPSMLVSTRGEVKDITEETKGIGIAGILTGGNIWGFRKINGLFGIGDMIKPKME